MMGGNLASVHNKDEYSFIKKLIYQHTRDTRITWIGGYDAVQVLFFVCLLFFVEATLEFLV